MRPDRSDAMPFWGWVPVGGEMTERSLRNGLLSAGGMLVLSMAMYVIFIGRHTAGERDWLTQVAALAHFPLAGVCGLVSLYLFVRHRSIRALGLIVGSCALVVFYLAFIP